MLNLALAVALDGTNQCDIHISIRQGQLQEALRAAKARLEHSQSLASDKRLALSRLQGDILLVLGREEQAEEHFRHQLRAYSALSRSSLRWLSALDGASLSQALNKHGRACELYNVAADDEDAPVALRIQCLAGLARSLHSLGEYRRSARTMHFASALAANGSSEHVVDLLRAMTLEFQVLRHLKSYECSDATLADLGKDDVACDVATLMTQLREASEALSSFSPLAARRMDFLRCMVDPKIGDAAHSGPVFAWLTWLQEHQMHAELESSRIEAGLAFLAVSDGQHAKESMGPMLIDESHIARHRRSLDLRYCVSRLDAMSGRTVSALRLYREYAMQAMSRIRAELPRIPCSRFLEKQEMAEQTDAIKLQLPLRYRRAYQFIMEHLDDKSLSIRQVAAYIEVSERALQLAFRSNIGMTPAGLIRTRRMERIRTELQSDTRQEGVLTIASRWGLNNRSTLAQNYRQQFGESPTSVRRHGANAHPHDSFWPDPAHGAAG